jgi:hypothetical protein
MEVREWSGSIRISYFEKTGENQMTSISEFIDSTALEETIITNCPKYREKFSNIVEKAGVGGSDIKDKEAIKKIYATCSWNWAAFLLNTHWAIYRKEKMMGWGLFTFIWLVAVISFYVPALDSVSYFLPMIAAFIVGIYGNSYVLCNSIRTYENTTSPEDRKQRSPIGLAVAIIVDVGTMVVLVFEEVI